MPAARRLSLRLVGPLLAGVGAAAGASAGYLLTGDWLYSIPGGAAGAWAASLLTGEAVSSAASQVAAGLRALRAGRPPEAGSASRFLELAEMEEALRDAADAAARLEASVSQDRNLLLAALNSTADAVVGVDNGETIRFANVAAERLFLRTREELVGRPFGWVVPNAEVIEALRASVREGVRQVRLLERPGRQVIEVATAPIIGGGEWAALVVFHDVSEVRRSESMRRDFVANVSHELRTPLASIRAVLDTLDGGALADEGAAREFIGRAQTEVERLTQMVAELLELSRIESGDPGLAREPFDAAASVREAVDRLQPQAARLGVMLTCQAPEGAVLVLGDEKRIEQAVVNLVHNALKFTAAGGEVRVSARPRDGTLEVTVEDTGVGIDERDLDRIFERFYKADGSRRSEGTGLGLSLVKHTAEAHGGSVSAQSEYGKGSRFTMKLPLLAAGITGAAPRAEGD